LEESVLVKLRVALSETNFVVSTSVVALGVHEFELMTTKNANAAINKAPRVFFILNGNENNKSDFSPENEVIPMNRKRLNRLWLQE